MTLIRPTDETDAFVQFGELTYYTAFAHAVTLKKLHMEKTEEGWQARVKGSRKGQNLVTYLSAPSYTRLVLLIGHLSDKDGLRWYPDKYP